MLATTHTIMHEQHYGRSSGIVIWLGARRRNKTSHCWPSCIIWTAITYGTKMVPVGYIV